MTAQVFRNPQQPTFYLGDVIAPSGSGGIAVADLTVSGVSNLGVGVSAGPDVIVHSAAAAGPAVEIRGVGAKADRGILVTQPGFLSGSLVGFGADTVDASPSGYVTASTGVDLKLGAGGAELLRLKNTGIAVNTAATSALALAAGSTTIFSQPLQSSGVFVPTWTNLTAWNTAPTVNIMWSRIGDIVHCSLLATGIAGTGGTASATFTLPIPRSTNFTTPLQCSGTAGTVDLPFNTQSGFVLGTLGSATTGTVTIYATAATSMGVRSVFMYRLAP